MLCLMGHSESPKKQACTSPIFMNLFIFNVLLIFSAFAMSVHNILKRSIYPQKSWTMQTYPLLRYSSSRVESTWLGLRQWSDSIWQNRLIHKNPHPLLLPTILLKAIKEKQRRSWPGISDYRNYRNVKYSDGKGRQKITAEACKGHASS